MTDEVPVGHLQRRKIEGRVLMPFIDACRKRFGDGPTRDSFSQRSASLPLAEGARWAEAFGGDIGGLRRIAEEVWAGGGGMELEVIDQTADRLDFDVTRCGYAEFYKELGLVELGYQIHCTRDFAMITGFNDDIEPGAPADHHGGRSLAAIFASPGKPEISAAPCAC